MDNLPDCIKIDRTRLKQIVSHLLDNAIKYTDKGEASLKVYSLKNKGDKDVDNLIFEVKDTGKGMSEEFQKRQFEVFEQAEKKTVLSGIGIGLALTQRNVKKMNGTIKVISQLGMGSSFIVTIPGISCKESGKDDIAQKELLNSIKEEKLSKEDIIDLPGLISDLEGSYLETKKTFEVRQPVGEVKRFGQSLVELGFNHKCRLISDYGQKLVEAANNFDIEGMLSLIKKYSENIEILQKQVD
jgi:hypothetical protein